MVDAVAESDVAARRAELNQAQAKLDTMLNGSRKQDIQQAEAGVAEGDAAIRAPMNGRLVKVAVEEGERVEPGQRLAVVEAMKMEHALVAPHAGVVRDLTANVGDQVEMGERIMRVEADAERAAERD